MFGIVFIIEVYFEIDVSIKRILFINVEIFLKKYKKFYSLLTTFKIDYLH